MKPETADHGFLYGFGLFETLRARYGRLFLINHHLRRLRHSSQALGIPIPSLKELVSALDRICRKSRFKDTYIRINVWKSARVPCWNIISGRYVPPSSLEYALGWRAWMAQSRRDPCSLLVQHKTFNYAENLLSRSLARKHKAQEAVFLNAKDQITEGAAANIFWVKGNILFTPHISCGLLPGITRAWIMRQAPRLDLMVREARAPIKNLLGADEAFLTNSCIGVMPLVSINGHGIGNGKPGRYTRQLVEKYFSKVLADPVRIYNCHQSP